jgi:hypothetical protein
MASSASASWMRQIGQQVRGVKFLLCPVTSSSKPALDFYFATYNAVKHLNPTLPYMVRPAPERPPSVVVEFDFGEKAHIPLEGLDVAGVERKVRAAGPRARTRGLQRGSSPRVPAPEDAPPPSQPRTLHLPLTPSCATPPPHYCRR